MEMVLVLGVLILVLAVVLIAIGSEKPSPFAQDASTADAVRRAEASFRRRVGQQAAPEPSSSEPSGNGIDYQVRISIGGRSSIEGPPSSSQECWQPAGHAVQIGDRTIDGGWIYVGSNLPSVSEWRGLEPALIDPSLPRDDARPDHRGEGMTYWPAYHYIPPACRSAYLEWLAGGRCDPEAAIGYVFLFFYGLERRALHDAEGSAMARRELPQIRAEVERLSGIYGGHASFGGYAGPFLEFLQLRSDTWEPGPEPPDEVAQGIMSPMFQVGVGHMAVNRTPLPAAWALAWARRDGEIRLRTPAERCSEDFGALFRIRYENQFGSGLRMRACKRKVIVRYHPASPSFLGSLSFETPYPDVTSLVGPRRRIQQLAAECCDALDAYSRWLGRQADGLGTLRSAAFIPQELLATRAPEAFYRLQRVLDEKVGEAPVALLPAEDVLGTWLGEATDKLTKKQAVEAAHLLAHAGFGVEPDVRFCGQKPQRDDQVAVFRVQGAEAGNPSAAYSAAVILLHLAAMVSAADGDVGTAEKLHLRDHLAAGLGLQADESQRLAAYLEWLLAHPPASPGGKKRLQALTAAQKTAIGEFLVAVAAADGRIDPAEVRILGRIFRLLDLDPGQVHDWLHAHQVAADSGPVPITSGEGRQPSGYVLPPRETSAATDGTLRLDASKIAAKLKESEKASATLAAIFADDDEPPAPEPVLALEIDSIADLDGPHSALLRRLMERSEWPRAAYEDLAGELGVLPDGALDLLNDLAFEVCDEPLIEGEDPLEVYADVAQEILA